MKKSFSPYDLTSAFQCAVSTARRLGEVRYVVQSARGYEVKKQLGNARYDSWRVNADGSVNKTDVGEESLNWPLTNTAISLNLERERGVTNGTV